MLKEHEIERLKKQTMQELNITDPAAVLKALGVEHKLIGNDSYRIKVRNEKTASAFISLRHGQWRYKDFGNDRSGNIVTVAMDAAGMDFKQALNFSLEKLNLKNYLDEAIKSPQQDYSLSKEQKEKIKQQLKRNQEREKSHAISKVTGQYDISTNQLAQDYLKSRGIIKIPPGMKVISGEYQTKSGEIKKAFGVGIATQSGGADIHFLKKMGDLKSMQFGQSDISFLQNPKSHKVAIFESKMDYAATFQQIDLTQVNVIIANSTSNSQKVADLMQQKQFSSVMFFNQNDLAGYEFVAQVAEKANLNDFKAIKYEIMSEYKQDVNDLHLNNHQIKERVFESDKEYFKNVSNNLQSLQQLQNQATLTRDDLKMTNINKEHEHSR